MTPELSSLSYFYEVKVRRDRLEPRLVWGTYLGAVLVSFGLSLAFGKPAMALPVAAVCSVLALPMVRAFTDASLLQTLIAGNCMDEIRQTRLTAAELVDTLAQCSVRRQMATMAIPSALAALWWLSSWNTPTGLLCLAAWLACVPLLTLPAVYFCLAQVGMRFSRGNPLDGVSTFFYAVAVASPLFVLGKMVNGSLQTDLTFHQGTLPGWPLYLLIALVVGAVVSRQMAVASLGQAERHRPVAGEAEGVLGTIHYQRTVQLRPWSENPIVARECARELGTLQGGWVGYVVHRWGMALAFTFAWLVTFYQLSLSGSNYNSAWVLSVLALVLGCRAGGRIQSALADERDRRTLEILVVSPLKSHDFVDGWAQVGYVPRVRELIVATVLQMALGGMVYQDWRLALAQLAAGLTGCLLIRGLAYFQLGVGMRACTKKREMSEMVYIIGGGAGTCLLFCLIPFNGYLFDAVIAYWSLGLSRLGRNLSMSSSGGT